MSGVPDDVRALAEAERIVGALRETGLIYNRGPDYEPLRCPPSQLHLDAANTIEALLAARPSVQPEPMTARAGQGMKTTVQMRQRLRELSTEGATDDYDRAVLALLDDFEALAPVPGGKAKVENVNPEPSEMPHAHGE